MKIYYTLQKYLVSKKKTLSNGIKQLRGVTNDNVLFNIFEDEYSISCDSFHRGTSATYKKAINILQKEDMNQFNFI